MAMFMTYTAKHYNDMFAADQDCAAATQPLDGSGYAYASAHTDALRLRDVQMNVSLDSIAL